MKKFFFLLLTVLVFSLNLFAQLQPVISPSVEKIVAPVGPPAATSQEIPAPSSPLLPVATPPTILLVAPSPVPTPEWAPKTFWSGDFRYRIAKAKEDVDEERTFQQLRARLGLKSDVNQDAKMTLRLATGTSATSTNQTLGDAKDPGMPRRNFGLDQAFLDWSFAKGSSFIAGRAPSPFWSANKSQLVLDSDLNLEGLSVTSEFSLPESKIFYSLGVFMISENYDTAGKTDVVDTGLWGAQLGYALKNEFGELKFSIAHFDYVNIRGKNIVTLDKDAKTDIYSIPYNRYKGNFVTRPDLAIADYFFQDKFVLTEFGLEYKRQWNSFEVLLFLESVENAAVDELNNGHEYGIAIRHQRIQVIYSLVEKEAESVVGAFTDSDSNGGGTDNRGTRINLNYKLSENSRVDWTIFNAERGMDSVDRKFSATQLDFLVSF